MDPAPARSARRRLVWAGVVGLGFAGLVGLAGAAVVAAPRGASAEEASRRAWLGVSAPEKGPAGGVTAKHVVNNSPAAKAGLVDGDLILSADGVSMAEPNQLVAKVALVGPGSTLPMRIRHGSVDRDVTASLIPFPGPEQILRLDKIGTFAPGWKAASAVAGSLPANLSAARGKVMLIDFWASWRGPCRMTAPQLTQWQASYGAQGLAVVGFTDDPVPVAAQSAQAWGMTYTVASDSSAATSQGYGVTALPSIFLVDKKGVIRDVFVGFDPGRHAEIEKTMRALLAEPAPP